jgi:hypothetical protein
MRSAIAGTPSERSRSGWSSEGAVALSVSVDILIYLEPEDRVRPVEELVPGAPTVDEVGGFRTD